MKYLREKKGFTGADVIIAISIIMLFTGIIVTISYNIYLATLSVKMTSRANSYINYIFETVDLLYYDDVTESNLYNEFYNKFENDKAFESFKIDIWVSTYNSSSGTLDLTKTVNVEIYYIVGNKDQYIYMSKTKARETFMTPNIPDIKSIASATVIDVDTEEYRIKPIKYTNGKWQVCSEADATWYNYNNRNWATVLILNENYSGSPINIGQTIGDNDIRSIGEILFWIPRYSYEEAYTVEIKFNYGTSTKYVGEKTDSRGNIYQYLEEIPSRYICDFSDNETGIWITENEADIGTLNEYYYLNSSKYERIIF